MSVKDMRLRELAAMGGTFGEAEIGVLIGGEVAPAFGDVETIG